MSFSGSFIIILLLLLFFYFFFTFLKAVFQKNISLSHNTGIVVLSIKVIWNTFFPFSINVLQVELQVIVFFWRRFSGFDVCKFCSKWQFWQTFLKDHCLYRKKERKKNYSTSKFLNKDTCQFYASTNINQFRNVSESKQLEFENNLNDTLYFIVKRFHCKRNN